ncbi:hypothetical protein FS837_011379 [Tulasnella sp. UAMH 9824]|nr:hypothetical protein FS837_011379 [Tulasnella sp. UAMH 9824]
MEAKINVMEATLTGVKTSLNTRLAQRKKHRNSLIRFNQLPLEIVDNILWLSIVDPWPQTNSYSFLQRQQTISLVCSSWRTLVEYSPRFWSIIELSCPPAVISHFLKKSQSSRLEIKGFEDTEYGYAPINVFEDTLWKCFISIAPHADRIRSLILSLHSPDGLGMVLANPAPMLEELKVDSAVRYNVQGFDLFRGQASRLKDVALQNMGVRWDSGVLIGLRSLSIMEHPEYFPTGEQMRRLLEANPGLEKLDIGGLATAEDFGNDAVQTTDEGKPGRVVMSKMQELRLLHLPFKLVQAVLGVVEVPSISHFELTCLFQGIPASRLLGPGIKHLVPPLLRLSTGTQQAEITLGESTFSLAIYTPRHESPNVQIDLIETMPIGGFDWLAEHLFHAEGLPSVCAAGIFQVSLKFTDRFDMAEGTFISVLNRLNAVKTIGSLAETEIADHLSIALQRRMQSPPAGETPAVLRPFMLEVLDIRGLHGVDEDVEKALAKCVAPSGTFIPGRRRRQRPLSHFIDVEAEVSSDEDI